MMDIKQKIMKELRDQFDLGDEVKPLPEENQVEFPSYDEDDEWIDVKKEEEYGIGLPNASADGALDKVSLGKRLFKKANKLPIDKKRHLDDAAYDKKEVEEAYEGRDKAYDRGDKKAVDKYEKEIEEDMDYMDYDKDKARGKKRFEKSGEVQPPMGAMDEYGQPKGSAFYHKLKKMRKGDVPGNPKYSKKHIEEIDKKFKKGGLDYHQKKLKELELEENADQAEIKVQKEKVKYFEAKDRKEDMAKSVEYYERKLKELKLDINADEAEKLFLEEKIKNYKMEKSMANAEMLISKGGPGSGQKGHKGAEKQMSYDDLEDHMLDVFDKYKFDDVKDLKDHIMNSGIPADESHVDEIIEEIEVSNPHLYKGGAGSGKKGHKGPKLSHEGIEDKILDSLQGKYIPSKASLKDHVDKLELNAHPDHIKDVISDIHASNPKLMRKGGEGSGKRNGDKSLAGKFQDLQAKWDKGPKSVQPKSVAPKEGVYYRGFNSEEIDVGKRAMKLAAYMVQKHGIDKFYKMHDNAMAMMKKGDIEIDRPFIDMKEEADKLRIELEPIIRKLGHSQSHFKPESIIEIAQLIEAGKISKEKLDELHNRDDLAPNVPMQKGGPIKVMYQIDLHESPVKFAKMMIKMAKMMGEDDMSIKRMMHDEGMQKSMVDLKKKRMNDAEFALHIKELRAMGKSEHEILEIVADMDVQGK